MGRPDKGFNRRYATNAGVGVLIRGLKPKPWVETHGYRHWSLRDPRGGT
ncbi:MAG: hypothetical protein JWM16_5199 [Verrucomicrobiales bacterium]|nr:hypothetical protein [Verrucomicrobiales bacterium]